jgi:hypothetical protein
MNSLILLFLFITLPFSGNAAEIKLEKILEMKPGKRLDKYIKTDSSNDDFSYEIKMEKGFIYSVRIDFSRPISPESFLKNDTKGFCLVQASVGDVRLNRYFFFDLETKRRYELTAMKKIKAILIEDIPGARANPACTFDSFNLKEEK